MNGFTLLFIGFPVCVCACLCVCVCVSNLFCSFSFSNGEFFYLAKDVPCSGSVNMSACHAHNCTWYDSPNADNSTTGKYFSVEGKESTNTTSGVWNIPFEFQKNQLGTNAPGGHCAQSESIVSLALMVRLFYNIPAKKASIKMAGATTLHQTPLHRLKQRFVLVLFIVT